MSEQTPRINAPLLGSFVGKLVRVVGRVNQQQGQKAVIDASGPITLNLRPVCCSPSDATCADEYQQDTLQIGNGVELIGKVLPNMEIRVLTCWDLGDRVGEWRGARESTMAGWLTF